MDRKMASRGDKHFKRTRHKSLLFDSDPNDSPYNSVSTFKNFDETVVSAYEVSSRGNPSKKLVKSQSVSDLRSVVDKVSNSVKSTCESVKAKLSSSDVKSHRNSDSTSNIVEARNQRSHRHNGIARIRPRPSSGVPHVPKEFGQDEINNQTTASCDEHQICHSNITLKKANTNHLDLQESNKKKPTDSLSNPIVTVQSVLKVYPDTAKTTGGSSRIQFQHSEKRSIKKLPSDSGATSPNHKHLVLPGNDTSLSGNLLSVNRRKLPKVPNQKSPVPKVMPSDKVDDRKKDATGCDFQAQHGTRSEKCDNNSLESRKMCTDSKSADAMHLRPIGCELGAENVSNPVVVDRTHQLVCGVYLENANARLKTNIVSKMASMEINDDKRTPGNTSSATNCTTDSFDTGSNFDLKEEVECVKNKQNVNRHELVEQQNSQNCIFDSNCSNNSIISDELEDPSDEALDPLSQSLPRQFTFDMNVIQELTDGVMCKFESKANHVNSDIQEQHNEAVATDMQESVSADLDKKNSDKLSIEGMSVFCKNNESVNKNGVEESGQVSTQREPSSNDEVSLLSGVHDSTVNQKILTQGRNVKVERTPSYRRKVMARVNSRYSKKSKNCKECSCMRKENGEIEVCSFCENYEILKKRSQSCLGHIALSDIGTDEYDSCNSDIPSPRRAFTPGLSADETHNSEGVVTGSPQPVKKVQVSPRVDILMSSNLFKKHLLKHEHLLHKHTTSYRKFGMKKAVSNLDISEGFVADNSTEVEREIQSGAVNSKGVTTDSLLVPNDHNCTRVLNRSRRFSLTGDSDSSVENYAIKERTKKQQVFGTIPKSLTNTRSRPPIPSFSDSRKNKVASYQIPSYHEFKKQKELSKVTPENQICNQTEKGNDIKDKANATNDEHFDKTRHTKANNVLQSTHHSENETVDDRCNKTNINEISETESDKTNSNVNSDDLRSESVSQHRILPQEREQSINKEKHGKRIRPKLKARTLSRIDFETEDLSNLSGSSDFGSASPRSPRGRHRTASKRPRSLISKKSSLISLIQESESKKREENKDKDKRNESRSERINKYVGHPVNRSESDSKYETKKGRNSSELYLNRQSKRDKGHNSVSFDLDDSSQCSTQDVGESDTSTSIAGSMSDSLHSESVSYDELGRLSTTTRDDADEDSDSRLKLGKEDFMAHVLRSTSDACEITPEAARKRRERKERPYKSDPFSGTEILPASKRCLLREEKAKMRMIQQEGFSSSSREEILSFLDCVSSSVLAECDSFPSLEELNEDDEQALVSGDQLKEGSRRLRKHLSNVSSLSTDSGVIGQDGSHDSQQSSPSNTLTYSMSEKRVSQWEGTGNEVKRSMSASCGDLRKKELHECQDCGQMEQFDLQCMTQICPQCYHRRIERKKTIQEIVDTEMNYGRDLLILKEEFYVPMKKAGLLSQEQLDSIFLNLDELTHVNKHFISKLKSSINSANHQNDEDLLGVMIGSLFLESSTMFLTFENYCVNQAQAPLLLEQLEREKELLRIFLRVSQNDNTLLRRMHLKSFLMVPVQRIMKYPLLLDRLYRTTVQSHHDKEALKEAKEKIEDILGNINARSKGTNLKHRKSEKHYSVTEKMEVSRVAMETLKWNRKDVCDVITSKLLVTQPVDHLWATKKCKNYKFTAVHGVLLSLLQPTTFDNERDTSISNDNNNNNNNNGNSNNSSSSNNVKIQSAAVVLIKEKNGKYQVLRDPFMLEKCVVSQDPDFTDVFEILEWNKESFLIKAEKPHETALWVQNLRQQMRNLGCWRRRRNALPNILLNHLS